MSIMLDEQQLVAPLAGVEAGQASEEALTALLKHVASELAEEYVQLMEAAAGEGCTRIPAPRVRQNSHESGDLRPLQL
jgi:hypothetical protein